MGKYSYYDEKEKVIFSKSADGELTPQGADEYFDETIKLAKSLPQKVFLVVSWKDVKMTSDAAKQYSTHIPELLKHVRGIVRYAAEDPLARIIIRAEMVKNDFQKSQAHIYSSREEALAAVRKLEKEQDSQK